MHINNKPISTSSSYAILLKFLRSTIVKITKNMRPANRFVDKRLRPSRYQVPSSLKLLHNLSYQGLNSTFTLLDATNDLPIGPKTILSGGLTPGPSQSAQTVV